MRIKDLIYFEDKIDLSESKILEENPNKILYKFGISSNQSKVYLCLSKSGPKTASQLAQILNLPRTETYHILKALKQKGCIHELDSKPMKFGALSIEQFLEKLIHLESQKLEKLNQILEMVKNSSLTQKIKNYENFAKN